MYKGFATRINPLRPIPPETSAVHGIADWDVEDKPPFDQVWPIVEKQIESVDVLVAHNAPFDRSFLPETRKPWLDT
ncbi:3'-5' exonuclease, partial [Sulfoacidibacillus thermotolerans]